MFIIKIEPKPVNFNPLKKDEGDTYFPLKRSTYSEGDME